MHVYPPEYSGDGRIYRYINYLQYIGIAVSQIIMYGVLYVMFNTKLFVFVIGGLQVVIYLIYYFITMCVPVGRVLKYISRGYLNDEDEAHISGMQKSRKDDVYERRLKKERMNQGKGSLTEPLFSSSPSDKHSMKRGTTMRQSVLGSQTTHTLITNGMMGKLRKDLSDKMGKKGKTPEEIESAYRRIEARF